MYYGAKQISQAKENIRSPCKKRTKAETLHKRFVKKNTNLPIILIALLIDPLILK